MTADRFRMNMPALWHELKTDPEPFNASFFGWKKYEIRLNDREFRLGDFVVLKETKHSARDMGPPTAGNGRRDPAPLEYTGRVLSFRITEVRTGYGIKNGWCILALKPITE